MWQKPVLMLALSGTVSCFFLSKSPAGAESLPARAQDATLGFAIDTLLTSDFVAGVRASLRRSGVGSGEPIALSRYYMCMSPSFEECADSRADTLSASLRREVRRELGQCPKPNIVPRVTVRMSKPRRRDETIAFLVDLVIDPAPSDTTGDEITFLVSKSSSVQDGVALRETYHATLARSRSANIRDSTRLVDDTCVG